MDAWVWIVIAVVAVVAVVAVLWSATRRRRTHTLKETFGREYDRTVEQAGGQRDAERELLERQKRHDELDLKPLSPESRERYVRRWEAAQTRFVDDPKGAVAEADTLVQEVMQERGYPTNDFERRVDDISVDHPELVEKYRTAHGIAQASERNEASTEDLRHSVRHYRALFSELLEVGVEGSADTRNVARLR
jgi:FtsZ-interacting cell division protein ZipA